MAVCTVNIQVMAMEAKLASVKNKKLNVTIYIEDSELKTVQLHVL